MFSQIRIIHSLLLVILAFGLCSRPLHAQTNARPERAFFYIHDEVPSVPWSVHILKVRRGHPDYEFYTTLGKSNALGMTLLTDQLKNFPSEVGQPVAAINGDYYVSTDDYPGDPRGLQIHGGELTSAPSSHVCFWIDPAGEPHMTNVLSLFRVVWPDGTKTPLRLNEERGEDSLVLYTSVTGPTTPHTTDGLELVLEAAPETPWLPLQTGKTYRAKVKEVRSSGDTPINPGIAVLSLDPRYAAKAPKVEPGAILQIITETYPDLTGARMGLGGGPRLVRDGKVEHWNGLQPRHPRVAFGWNKDFYYMVEVDGRQSNLSVGMSFPELSEYMLKLGCDQAMNFDGGGSATFWLAGGIVNSPSEKRERPSANCLVLVRKKRLAKSGEK